MSINAVLSIARSALWANQKAVQVTSHNISNAGTPGYTRQQPMLTAAMPLIKPYGSLGTGVTVRDIGRVRDALLDASLRRDSGTAAGFTLRRDILGRIEAVFGEPSESGLSAKLDALWAAWGDLATEPVSFAARALVAERAQQVAGTFNRLADAIGNTRESVERQLAESVRRVNTLTTQIADLNRQIVAAEVGGITSPDLRDARDLALDELATLADIQVIEESNGAVGVLLAGTRIVDRAEAFHVSARQTPAGWAIGIAGRQSTLDEAGARLSGLLDLLNRQIPDRLARLDQLAGALVQRINELHRSGTNPDGETDLDFFDPAGTTAAHIRVIIPAASIAAGTADADGNYRAGANDVALAMAGLRLEPQAGLGASFGDFYIDLVTDIGLAVLTSGETAEAHRVLAEQSEARRASLTGVSIDEELIQLLQFQAAYAAAAKTVSAADEMLHTLLNM